MSWSKTASNSTAKQSHTQPTSYHAPCAGNTVANSRQWRYQATTNQTTTNIEPRAQPLAIGSIEPRT